MLSGPLLRPNDSPECLECDAIPSSGFWVEVVDWDDGDEFFGLESFESGVCCLSGYVEFFGDLDG